MFQNPYDSLCRYVAKEYALAILAWLLGLPLNAFAFRRWLDTRTLPIPGEPDRTCDTIAHLDDLRANGLPWALILDFQIEPDPLMFGRFLTALGSLWLDEKPSRERGDRFCVGAMVVNLTGTGYATRRMTWAEAGVATNLIVREWNLCRESAAHYLNEVASGRLDGIVLGFIPLMQGGDDPIMIARCIELARADPDAKRRADFGMMALVFAERSAAPEAWKTALEGWNMIVSKQVQEWKAEGKLEGKADSVLTLLEEQFRSVPPDIVTRVRALKDLDILNGLVLRAARCNSLEEFRGSLPAAQES